MTTLACAAHLREGTGRVCRPHFASSAPHVNKPGGRSLVEAPRPGFRHGPGLINYHKHFSFKDYTNKYVKYFTGKKIRFPFIKKMNVSDTKKNNGKSFVLR